MMGSSIRRSPVYFVLTYLISWGGSVAVGAPEFLRGTPLTFDDGIKMAAFMLAGPCAAGTAVFCTYKTAVGGMLPKMAARLESRGADVTGSFKSRGPYAAEGFKDWVESLG